MPPKPSSNTPRPSERRAAKDAPADLPTPLRKYYLAAAAFLFVGDVIAIAKTQTIAVIIFSVLTLMMLWIAWRVDRLVETRRPSDRPSSKRPY